MDATTEIGGRDQGRVSLELDSSGSRPSLLRADVSIPSGLPRHYLHVVLGVRGGPTDLYHDPATDKCIPFHLDLEACFELALGLGPDGQPRLKVVADPDCKVNEGSGPPRGPNGDTRDPR